MFSPVAQVGAERDEGDVIHDGIHDVTRDVIHLARG